jgi:hypothetical protein
MRWSVVCFMLTVELRSVTFCCVQSDWYRGWGMYNECRGFSLCKPSLRRVQKTAKSEATISFVMFVCLHASVWVEQLGSQWTDFHEISYLIIFRKYVKEMQVL